MSIVVTRAINATKEPGRWASRLTRCPQCDGSGWECRGCDRRCQKCLGYGLVSR